MNETKNIPRHIALIMDGNGRWAKERGKKRTFGHKEGAKAVKRAVEAAGNLGIKYLTLFAFSSENWKRPKEEVDTLMNLLRDYLKNELKELLENNVVLRVIGSRKELDKDIAELIEAAEKETYDRAGSDPNHFTLIIAVNYGGKDEIVNAAKEIAKKAQKGEIKADDIDEGFFEENLWMKDIPNADIVVRTSGEKRISNFILWKLAYAELMFLNIHWPDFKKENMEEIINEYQKRERRFGAV
jgi:undecaprenyl diphosphate synthase